MEGVMTDKQILRSALCGFDLHLDISNDYYAGIFAEIDSFVALSQGNDTIGRVHLSPYNVDPGKYELWDKVGQGVGNLRSLGVLCIYHNNSLGGPRVDWEILARILPHVQSKIVLRIVGYGSMEGRVEMQAFVRAIQGQPAMTRFETRTQRVSYESAALLCSALSTLPNLESAVLLHRKLGRGERVPTLRFPESMTEFLRTPSLRIVELKSFCFTSSLCQAAAMALRQGSSITSLNLHECSFPEGGSEQIASALMENATLTTFKISPSQDSIYQAFYDAMAASLLSNSTLQELSIGYTAAIYPASGCLSSLFLALGMNKTLKHCMLLDLDLDSARWMDR
jgi:hypothetical protein